MNNHTNQLLIDAANYKKDFVEREKLENPKKKSSKSIILQKKLKSKNLGIKRIKKVKEKISLLELKLGRIITRKENEFQKNDLIEQLEEINSSVSKAKNDKEMKSCIDKLCFLERLVEEIENLSEINLEENLEMEANFTLNRVENEEGEEIGKILIFKFIWTDVFYLC
jgi:hypothetical protein